MPHLEQNKDLIIKQIKHFSKFLFQWFDFKYMKINSGKSPIFFSGNNILTVHIDNNAITSKSKNELLRIVLDTKLFFEDHINSLCKKASQELIALARIAPYMCIEKNSYESICNII